MRGNEKAEAEIEVRRAAGDAAGAATVAIKAYGPQILGYLSAILRDDDDAADAFSVFCEDVWRGLPGFRGESAVRTWAYRLAWRVAMRARGGAYRKKRVRLATTSASALAAEVRSTTAAHLKPANLDRLAEARRSMTPEEQTLLVLRVDRDLPWKEIAVVFADEAGRPADEAALRKRFERLKEKLRTKLR